MFINGIDNFINMFFENNIAIISKKIIDTTIIPT